MNDADARSDRELVRLAQGGSRDALGALLRRWNDPMVRLAHRLTGSPHDAEDVRQRALLKCHAALPRFKADAEFSTWLFRIVVNAARDVDRSRRVGARNAASLDPSVAHSRPAPPDAADELPESAAAVRDAVMALPEHLRSAIVLRHYLSLPFPAVAAVLEKPETTVKSHVLQALREVRRSLVPQHTDPTVRINEP
jgi:RNA polymerase sigma-70 factor (ECF subfamily)